MLTILVYIVFLFSVSFAAGAIIIASRLRNKSRADFLPALFYFEVFIFAFGFYGIWGQVVIKSFLPELVSRELMSRFMDISVFLGLPFLIFAWLMLLRFSSESSGSKPGKMFVPSFLVLNFLALLLLGLLLTRKSDMQPAILIRYFFIILSIAYSFAASFKITLGAKGEPVFRKKESVVIGVLLPALALLQSLPLLFYEDEPLTGLLFIFLFFGSNAALPLYIYYGTGFGSSEEKTSLPLTFEQFCRKFEISPRESEIILEICKGLSNKEISDRLFISLQTVKDHTSRIYFKTNVKSRVQLINLVKDYRESDTNTTRI